MMRRSGLVALAILLGTGSACSDSATDSTAPESPPRVGAPAHPDHALFIDAARSAWSYLEREYQPETGWVNSVTGYPYATVWDIASGLSALYCGRRLELIGAAEYDRRMRRALLTLQTVPLFDRTAFNKNYSTETGALAGRDDRDTEATERGIGWSAVDLGRLLVWLRIIAENDPQHATDVQRVVARIDFSKIVEAGYLHGATLAGNGPMQRYVEGRVGYEQYAATGFELWGHRAEGALSLTRNTLPIAVMDVPLLADRRGHDHLTSEPFLLMGLETGWRPEIGDLAAKVLRVQEERHRRTGQVTMVSEDAVPVPPHFFYYYAINYHGNQFVVGAQGAPVLEEPRWVSAKAAFGWHALLPSVYTRLAVDAVGAARGSQRGWSSGVYEGTGKPTGSENVNTAAVILQSALFSLTGKPLLAGG